MYSSDTQTGGSLFYFNHFCRADFSHTPMILSAGTYAQWPASLVCTPQQPKSQSTTCHWNPQETVAQQGSICLGNSFPVIFKYHTRNPLWGPYGVFDIQGWAIRMKWRAWLSSRGNTQQHTAGAHWQRCSAVAREQPTTETCSCHITKSLTSVATLVSFTGYGPKSWYSYKPQSSIKSLANRYSSSQILCLPKDFSP